MLVTRVREIGFAIPRFPGTFPRFLKRFPGERSPAPGENRGLPDSRFPIPDSRFPIPDSRFVLQFGGNQESGNPRALVSRFGQDSERDSPGLGIGVPRRPPAGAPGGPGRAFLVHFDWRIECAAFNAGRLAASPAALRRVHLESGALGLSNGDVKFPFAVELLHIPSQQAQWPPGGGSWPLVTESLFNGTYGS
jgi:hypothetical protein